MVSADNCAETIFLSVENSVSYSSAFTIPAAQYFASFFAPLGLG